MSVVVFSFGRINPPTLGHLCLAEEIRTVARQEGGDAVMVLSRSQDRERNPLDPITKMGFAVRAFGGIRVDTARTVFDAIAGLVIPGVERLMFVVGADRIAFAASLDDHVRSLGLRFDARIIERDDDAISATQARDAVRRGDPMAFRATVPSPDETFVDELYEALSVAMQCDREGKDVSVV